MIGGNGMSNNIDDMVAVDIKQGETWTMGITCYGPDDVTPLNLTDATVTGCLRDRPGGAKAADITCTITDAIAGKIHCQLEDEVTATIAGSSTYDKSKTYYFDVKVETADGVGYYAAKGTMAIWGGALIE
jgi:hypothetical protein